MRPGLLEQGRLVRELGLTDLCLSTEANYTRHLVPDRPGDGLPGPSPVPRTFSFGDLAPARPCTPRAPMTNWLERQRNILDFTLSSLLRRKWKNLALACRLHARRFPAGLGHVLHLRDQDERHRLLLDNAPEMTVQRILAGRHSPVPAGYLDRIKDIPGVHSVRGRLWGYYFDPVVGANYTLVVPEAGRARKGDDPGGRRGSPGAVAPGRGHDRVQNGGRRDPGARGAGVLPGRLGARFLATSSSSRPRISWPSRAAPRITSPTSRSASGTPASWRPSPRRSPNGSRTRASSCARRSCGPTTPSSTGGAASWSSSWAGAMLAFIILAWDKASGLGPEERREIGILKAIGWETSDVLLMKFWEGMTVSLSSFFLGLVLAYVHVFTGGSGAVRARAQGLVRPPPRIPARPLPRRGPGRGPLFPDRRPLLRRHDHSGLAGVDRRPRLGDAVRRPC